MSVRQWANNHPKATGSVAGACVLVCVAVLLAQAFGGRRAINVNVPDDYFTVDDGKTFFAASCSNIPPFNYQGKTAVRANVFDCNGVKFVGYMDRYTPQAQQVMGPGKPTPGWVDTKGRELKKPSDANWISATDAKSLQRVITVTTPPGLAGMPVTAEP